VLPRYLALCAMAVIAASDPAAAAMVKGLATVPSAKAMREGGDARPPLGFIDYCRRYPIDCRALVMPPDGAAGEPVAAGGERWSELVRVNREVNAAIRPRADLEQHRIADLWSLAPAAGDCEDYALTKRRRLQALGWPSRSLLIAIARDRAGSQHAVLVARTDRGDLVLDNLSDDIVEWTRLDYGWIKRQSVADPRYWVTLVDAGEDPPAERPAD
jgi:predicted transglutaminase-like cysteine proteinase